MRSLRCLGLAALAGLGCQPSATAEECLVQCSSAGGCPSGMICASDGYCHAEGDVTDCSPEPPSQITQPPDGGSCAGGCNAPPPPSCVNECTAVSYQATGTCLDGACTYAERDGLACPHGCDDATGTCRDAEEACPEVACGTTTTCGGVCTEGSGCCLRNEICGNGVDDDCDGAKDCQDSECAGTDPFCCTGSGLVHVVPDGCINDGGSSGRDDGLLVFCCENVARFCLSNEFCPWRGGCGYAPDETCNRSGLGSDYMANAGCGFWRDRVNYYCSADNQIYFP